MIHVLYNILVYIILVQLFLMQEEVHLNFKLQRAGLIGLKYLFRKQ